MPQEVSNDGCRSTGPLYEIMHFFKCTVKKKKKHQMKEAYAKVTLVCGVYGEGSVLSVKVASNAKVTELRDVIARELKIHPRFLTLRFAWKEGEGWLQCDEDLDKMLAGQVDSAFKKMMLPCPLVKNESGDGYLESALESGYHEVHVLVEAPYPNEFVVEMHEEKAGRRELQYYQQQGKLIQDNCKDYCMEILRKIDELYASSDFPLPFICIEGSSGMGKTQLAFALEGRRPWFYWIATPITTGSQPIYKNFLSISTAFSTCVDKDELMGRKEELVLRLFSRLYLQTELWTYGFIRALLQYCSSREQQHSHMIRFDESVTLNVKKCTCNDVDEVIGEMKKQKKELPFFILDEMITNEKSVSGGKIRAAFQRNVFRALGLVVLIMGTDSEIAQLMEPPSTHSSGAVHNWMSVVPCFPPYQIMLRTDIERHAWEMIVKQYPVVETIARGSRGRFARWFLDEGVTYVTNNRGTIELYDLLDEVFGRVCFKAQQTKHYMSKVKGRYAQLMAISFTNSMSWPSEDELCEPPPPKRQKRDGTLDNMELHFANLVDKRLTDVVVSVDELSWKPRCCFPDIEENMLLYLAVLGGKAYSSYHDCTRSPVHGIVAYSTKSIFLEQLDGVGFSGHENTHAESRDLKMFENMVAHALFCASRRNGVQGILFNDFYAWLLGEFQPRSTMVKMTTHDASGKKEIVASDLLDGYSAQEAMGNGDPVSSSTEC